MSETPEEKRERIKREMEEGGGLNFSEFFPPDTPLTGVARAQHEVAGTFEEQGFTRAEALYMTAAMFSGNPGLPPNS